MSLEELDFYRSSGERLQSFFEADFDSFPLNVRDERVLVWGTPRNRKVKPNAVVERVLWTLADTRVVGQKQGPFASAILNNIPRDSRYRDTSVVYRFSVVNCSKHTVIPLFCLIARRRFRAGSSKLCSLTRTECGR